MSTQPGLSGGHLLSCAHIPAVAKKKLEVKTETKQPVWRAEIEAPIQNLCKKFVMRNLKFLPSLIVLTLAFALSGLNAAAQPGMGGMGGMGGRGGFGAMMGDPAQRAQMQVDSLRESLTVTNDAEWNIISQLLLKVVQLKSEQSIAEISRMIAPMMAMMGGGRGGMGGAANFLGVQPDPSADALQMALDGHGTVAQVKAALARFREAKKQKQDALAKAQDALKEVLSARQEAVLALAGYLE